MKYALIAIAAVALLACTDDDNTFRTLKASGFTDIAVTGYSWFECGEGDAYHTGFVAKNTKGDRVEGTVCCGLWFKGCTVRF